MTSSKANLKTQGPRARCKKHKKFQKAKWVKFKPERSVQILVSKLEKSRSRLQSKLIKRLMSNIVIKLNGLSVFTSVGFALTIVIEDGAT